MEAPLLQPFLALFLVLVGLVFIVSGRRGVGQLAGCVLAPFRAALGALTLLVFVTVLMVIFLPEAGTQLLEGVHGSLRQLFGARRDTVEPLIRFEYPVGVPGVDGVRRGEGWVVTQDWADTMNPVAPAQEGRHLGEDWAWAGGTSAGREVYSVSNGRVLVAGSNRSFGHVVIIRHQLTGPSDLEQYVLSLYGHLGPDLRVSAGDSVLRGQGLGLIGVRGQNGVDRLGNSFPPHLHFELRRPHPGDTFPGFGYGAAGAWYLNPTDRTSPGNTPGGGWIDQRLPR